MEITTASSALALFETTKEQRESFAQAIIAEIKEGNIDPLKVHMQLKSAEHLLKTVNDNPEYKSLLLDQAQKHGKKFETYNAEFQVREAGVSYDYTKCEDVSLDTMYEELAELKKKIKAREETLKHLPLGGLADTETGAVIYPPVKTSTTIVQCTLK